VTLYCLVAQRSGMRVYSIRDLDLEETATVVLEATVKAAVGCEGGSACIDDPYRVSRSIHLVAARRTDPKKDTEARTQRVAIGCS